MMYVYSNAPVYFCIYIQYVDGGHIRSYRIVVFVRKNTQKPLDQNTVHLRHYGVAMPIIILCCIAITSKMSMSFL